MPVEDLEIGYVRKWLLERHQPIPEGEMPTGYLAAYRMLGELEARRESERLISQALRELEERGLQEGDALSYENGACVIYRSYQTFVETLGGSSIPLNLVKSAIRGGARVVRKEGGE